MEQKFDLIISNPPFSIGNKVITTCLPYCEEAVVLMPIGSYKKSKKLYQNVETIEMIDFSGFDADIGGLSITRLKNDIFETSLSKFELKRVDKRFKDFFELNYLLDPIYIDRFKALYGRKHKIICDVNTTFVTSAFASINGVCKSGNDVEYNLHFNPVKINISAIIYLLKSRKHKENLNRFWYGNPLMTQLLHAYNCNCGLVDLCIPRIDWSVERDYEHMSYEELLEIMKDELNKQNKRKDN